MSIYDYLLRSKGTKCFDQLFKHHIFCSGIKISFERYSYFLELVYLYPEESHFHLVLDTALHFGVSEQTIYSDISKMELEFF